MVDDFLVQENRIIIPVFRRFYEKETENRCPLIAFVLGA